MMMDHQPFIPDALEEIGGKDAGLLRFLPLLGRDIFDADDPAHIAGDLDHHFGEFKLHRERIVEDEHPGITHGRPFGTERPAGMHTGDIFKMRPHLVHLGDVERLKGVVESLISFGDFFDPLLDHAYPRG